MLVIEIHFVSNIKHKVAVDSIAMVFNMPIPERLWHKELELNPLRGIGPVSVKSYNEYTVFNGEPEAFFKLNGELGALIL